MTKYYLNSISIEGFRGINNQGKPLNIQLKSDGVTTFYGENGMAKSSIFEAFIFSLLGRIIRFDDYHRDIVDRRTIKNLFHVGDGEINIEFIDSSKNTSIVNIKVGSTGERSISSPSYTDPEIFLESLCSSLNFLDHKSFEKIILQSSEETGKLFSNLVGFGSFNDVKDKLDKISRKQNINSDFGKTIKEQTIQSNEQKIIELKFEILQKLKEIEIDLVSYDYKNIYKLLKSFLQKQYAIKLQSILNDSQFDFDQLIKLKVDSKYEENVSLFNEKLQDLYVIKGLKNSIKSFNKKVIRNVSRKLKDAYNQVKTYDDIILGKLYDISINSYDSMVEFDKNSCILCSTKNLGVGNTTFYEIISNKIKSYNKYKEKYNSFFETLENSVEICKVIDVEKRYFNEDDRFFASIVSLKDYVAIDFFELNDIEDIISSYKEKINNELIECKLQLKQLKTQIPPNISRLIEIHNTYKFIFKAIQEIKKLETDNRYNNKFLKELENWTNFAEKIKGEYEDAYNTLMDEIATMIDADTKDFFKEIMGNVDIKPKIRKEYKGQKVNILLEKFYNNSSDIKAATLLSESYRNALCLSIYFAAALRSKNYGNFIIVDDITSSFDSGHQVFLLDLIKSKIALHPRNKRGKQIILLTHDGMLKKMLNEYNNLPYWVHYNLSANRDIVSLKPLKSEDLRIIIQNKISEGNYLGSDFRMYYEKVLIEIIENLNLEIPYSLIYSNDEKMINKLISAIAEIVELKRKSKKIKARLNIPSKSDFKIYIQQLTNNLSHWVSGSSLSLSSPVLNKIIDDIDDFKRCFQYNCNCSAKNLGWVYYKSLSSPKQKGCNCTI